MRTNLHQMNQQCALPPRPRVFRRRVILPTATAATSAVASRRLELADRADRVVVSRLTHRRDNMADYEAQYPAAVQVRDQLGDARWEKLERYRGRVATFAAFMRKLDREHLAVPRADLDGFYKTMKRYVKRACGAYMQDIFMCFHDTLDQVIEEDTIQRVSIQDGYAMNSIRECFHRRPYLWFVYNLYFPVEGRMSWDQLREWAIWTLQNPMEEPSWFTWLAEDEQVALKPPSANRNIWNRALIEVFTDVGEKFFATT